MNLMTTYQEKLNDAERAAIERALDELGAAVPLANDDRAARAAEALAVYVLASRPASVSLVAPNGGESSPPPTPPRLMGWSGT